MRFAARRRGVLDPAEPASIGGTPVAPPTRGSRGRLTGGCAAPDVQLFFRPDGEIRACCRNERPLGTVTTGVVAAWEGTRRRELRDALAEDDDRLGCSSCGAEVEAEGRVGSYPATFDEWATGPSDPSWPTILDFNVSIACNLQCIQCNGEQSSAIRIHREHRPPLVSPYHDAFYDEIRPFLRHARLARFAGGEPFLAPENHRIWELVATEAPDLPCVVITNATIWNDRVAAALDAVRMGFILSIDGITAATYEAIRVGADFDEVMANVDRFVGHARTAGTPISVNHCLMVQNHHEFADLLLWAEARELRVDVSVVRDPDACSIARLDTDRLVEVQRELLRRADDVAGLELNRSTWDREVARIGRWAALDDTSRRALWGISGRMVLMFKSEGTGPNDDRVATADVSGFAGPDGRLATLTVDTDQRIVACTTPEALGLAAEDLIGRDVSGLAAILSGGLGAYGDQRTVAESPDRVDATFRLGPHDAMVAMVALRDDRGWADRARMVFGLRPPA